MALFPSEMQMYMLCSDIDLEGFFNALGEPRERALLLDYDGTLAPFVVDRGKALPFDGVVEALNEILDNRKTRVVFVSGRPVLELLRLLEGLTRLPQMWGSHGWEHRCEDGTITRARLRRDVARGLESAYEWCKLNGLDERCERKHGCCALHVRGLDEHTSREVLEACASAWKALTEGGGLRLAEFDGGIEIRAVGCDKGFVVRTVLGGLAPDAVVAYAGDDRTDEDAFRELAGRGLRFLVRDEPRPTQADVCLTPPGELVWLLRRWADAERRAD